MSVGARASWSLPETFLSEGQAVRLGSLGRGDRPPLVLLHGTPLRHWRLSKPDVVAHDFGGCTALRAHLLHGCEYGSLTLIDPVALAPW
jgi:pimeloyl-ACP methyl ester carboxylesterase